MARLTASELNELRQLYRDLENFEIPNMNDFIRGLGGVEGARKDLEFMRKTFQGINSDVTDLSKLLKEVVASISTSGTSINQSRKGFRDLSDIANKLRYDQDGITRLGKKDLENLDDKIKKSKILLQDSLARNAEDQARVTANLRNTDDEREITRLTKQLSLLRTLNQATVETFRDLNADYYILNNVLQQRIAFEKEANNVLGISGILVKGLDSSLSKLGLGGLANLDEIKEKMQEVADEAVKNGNKGFAAQLSVLKTGAVESAKAIYSQLGDPVLVISALISIANKADQQMTELAKSMTITKNEAYGIREQFTQFNREIGDSSVTTDRLLKSFSQLTNLLGFNVPLSKDLLKEFTKLTNNIGISEESAAGLGRITLATGKSARNVTVEALGTAQALQSQYGIQLDNRKVLDEIGKVSGQLLANFRANPSAIAEAVTQAQLLGTTLERTKRQGETLLNFESSISNELKAELLTGGQMNLERARAASLMGNQVELMKELSNQNMNFTKFSQMNVIAQKSFAESLGLSSDELSDQLFKQQMLGKSKAQVLAMGGEEAAQRLEALSAQDKFNNAIEKLQNLLGNLIDGPLGLVLNMVADLAGNARVMSLAFGTIVGMSFHRILMSLGLMTVQLLTGAAASAAMVSALTLGIGIAAVVAGMVAFSSSMKSMKQDIVTHNDAVVGPGSGKVLFSGAEGAIRLNDKDTVIAGTNLFDKKEGSGDMNSVILAINEVKRSVDKLMAKDSSIYMDSKTVGNTLVQGSIKLA